MGAIKLLTLEQKMAKDYCVRAVNMPYAIKDVDLKKKTVKGVLNTYWYYDSYGDVLVPGVAKQSVAERGPNSDAIAKIKFAKNHDLNVRPGSFQVLEERAIEGRTLLYFEGKTIDTQNGRDTLIEYQEGVIDNHSIGFNYAQLEFLDKDSEDWQFYFDQLINPEDAEENGFMWIVKQIYLWEGSALTGFGANELTPYLGVKNGAPSEHYILKIFNRVDLLNAQLKNGHQSDERMKDYEIQVKQLKQIIREVIEKADEPSLKDTLIVKPSGQTILTVNKLSINLK